MENTPITSCVRCYESLEAEEKLGNLGTKLEIAGVDIQGRRSRGGWGALVPPLLRKMTFFFVLVLVYGTRKRKYSLLEGDRFSKHC